MAKKPVSLSMQTSLTCFWAEAELPPYRRRFEGVEAYDEDEGIVILLKFLYTSGRLSTLISQSRYSMLILGWNYILAVVTDLRFVLICVKK